MAYTGFPATYPQTYPQYYPQYQQAPPPPPQYQYQQPYNYGYPANNNGYGCSNNQVDAGYPGFSDPMYGKDPAAYRGGY